MGLSRFRGRSVIKSEDIAVDLKTANVYTIDMGNSLVHVFGIAGYELSSELVRQ